MSSSLTFLYGRPTAPQWQNKELIPDGQIFGRKVLIEKGHSIFKVLVNFNLPLVYKSCMEIRFYRLFSNKMNFPLNSQIFPTGLATCASEVVDLQQLP
jgi:hypothetical protein